MQKPNGANGLATINPLTDEELISNAAEQDMLAFEQLYARYSPILYSLIKKIISDTKTSEKILIEVFLIFWKRISDFDKDNLFTSLVLLARNKALDFLSRQGDSIEQPEYNEDYERFKIFPHLSREIKSIKLHQALKIKKEIGEMFKNLTDAQRLVLSLFYFEGLNEKQISQKLKIPVPTVRSKLQVATDIMLEKTKSLVPQNG